MNIGFWLNKVKLYGFSNNNLYYECLLILKFVLKKDFSWIISNFDFNLSKENLIKLDFFLIKRLKGEPIYYIWNQGFFWSFFYQIHPDVFIPRSDTEIMVDYLINLIKLNNFVRILDLGTGSGVISLAISKECKNTCITSIDLDLNALNLAKNNSIKLKLFNICFLKSFWFKKIKKNILFDVIISNPPYVNKNHSCMFYLNDLRFESYINLVSENYGLSDIIYLIYNSYFYLFNKGWLIIEHSCCDSDKINFLFSKRYFNIYTYKYFNNNYCFTVGQKNI